MKPLDRKRLAQILGSVMPGLQARGRLVVVTPVARILRGFYIEDSSSADRSYLWSFVQPLFIPSTSVVLSLGYRLGGGSCSWRVADAEAVIAAAFTEGLPLFESINSAEALLDWGFLDRRSDEYAREVRAYAFIASGRYPEGAQILRAFSTSLDAGPPWISEMKHRAEQLAIATETSASAAQQILARWERETKSALRLEDLP